MTAPAGWYPDPNDKTMDRYWDGQAWGGARPRPPEPPVEKERTSAGAVAAALLLPIVGVVIAITYYGRGRTSSGHAVLLTSILAGLVWGYLLVP